MNRLGLLTPESLSAEQKDFYDEVETYTTSKYGATFVLFSPTAAASEANMHIDS